MDGAVGLIGLGVIGAPIAQRLSQWDSNRFVLIASGARRKKLENKKIYINEELFSPKLVSEANELETSMDLLIVCVKNFQLQSALKDIRNLVSDNTILLPLENGICAYRTLREEFPNNIILEGYAQGPNTKRVENGFLYTNSGKIHMGSSHTKFCDAAITTYLLLKEAKVNVVYEAEIRRMVWKKWMLNTAGNTVTALLDAGYAEFKHSEPLQNICRMIMMEFVQIAQAEHIYLSETDIDDVIQYFVTYKGEKITSMLEDVRNHHMTENEYITGEVIRLAKNHGIKAAINETMYMLIKAKESLYL